jgi:hypothetical protein
MGTMRIGMIMVNLGVVECWYPEGPENGLVRTREWTCAGGGLQSFENLN